MTRLVLVDDDDDEEKRRKSWDVVEAYVMVRVLVGMYGVLVFGVSGATGNEWVVFSV